MPILTNKSYNRVTTITASALMVLFLNLNPAEAVTVNIAPGTTNFRLLSITDLLVSGTFYDATFTHLAPFNTLASPSITFTNSIAASTARDAIAGAIIGATIDPAGAVPPDFTNVYFVPYMIETNGDVTSARGFVTMVTINPFVLANPL